MKAVLYNTSDDTYHVQKGQRLLQGVLLKGLPIRMQKVNTHDETQRGESAFGSTGAMPAVRLIEDGEPAAPGPWWDHERSPVELSRMFKAAPAMPVVDRTDDSQKASEQPHRNKLPYFTQIHREMHDALWDGADYLSQVVAVARSVNKKEAAGNPKAQQAMQEEWDRLRAIGTWNEDGVRELDEVRKEAKNKGQTIHIGRLFPILVEKNSELPEDSPERKFKGRVVFDGSDVRDQDRQVALFQELSSSPATMQASKAADAYGSMSGDSIQQADAIQAYTQSKLGGTLHGYGCPKKGGRHRRERQGTRTRRFRSCLPYMATPTQEVSGKDTVTGAWRRKVGEPCPHGDRATTTTS